MTNIHSVFNQLKELQNFMCEKTGLHTIACITAVSFVPQKMCLATVVIYENYFIHNTSLTHITPVA